jgi:hypothetical protein
MFCETKNKDNKQGMASIIIKSQDVPESHPQGRLGRLSFGSKKAYS